MKRSLALIGVLTALIAGCGGNGKKGSSKPPAQTGAAGKQVRVGLVPDVSGLSDRGFNHLSLVGVKQAASKLGSTYRVFLSTSAADYVPNLTAQGYDLVVGVGYTEAGAVDTVASRFPRGKFAIVDVDQGSLPHKPNNVVGLLFREQEAGYLVGYLAGLEEKRRPGPDVIGSVGGEKQPPIDRFIAGYQAGAKAADPGIKVLYAYANDPTFADQGKCKDVALNQIAAGAGAIFQVAGGCGLGALDAARERHVWGIGVDADQSFLGPHILTSAVKRVDTAVFDVIKQVVDGTFKGGDLLYGLRDNGVGLGKISPKVPQSEIDAVNKVKADIVSGKIKSIPTIVK